MLYRILIFTFSNKILISDGKIKINFDRCNFLLFKIFLRYHFRTRVTTEIEK